jgi:hypothetical protein
VARLDLDSNRKIFVAHIGDVHGIMLSHLDSGRVPFEIVTLAEDLGLRIGSDVWPLQSEGGFVEPKDE